MAILRLVGAYSEVDSARRVARDYGGQLFCDERDDTAHLPFAALVSAATDDLEPYISAADIGSYLVCERIIKPRPDAAADDARLPGVIGLFAMVARADLTHRAADHYWRDHHAPLALRVHVGMSHYRQLSVLHRFDGPQWNGFALCGFDCLADLREKFYATAEGKQAIADDVAQFADTQHSPRRLIATEYSYSG